MATEDWEVPAVVSKADTLALSALQCTVGIVSMAEATGEQFDCEVMFLGFRGRWNMEDGKFHGAYRFGPVEDPEKHKRFTTLPGSGVHVVEVTMDESEVDDGVHSDDS